MTNPAKLAPSTRTLARHRVEDVMNSSAHDPHDRDLVQDQLRNLNGQQNSLDHEKQPQRHDRDVDKLEENTPPPNNCPSGPYCP